VVYRDGKAGVIYAKRFNVTGLTRDKEYNLTKETPGSRITYFSANPNGEAEIIRVLLKPQGRIKKLNFEYDFADLMIKGRASMGNILSRTPVQKITLKAEGVSTLGGRKIWFDPDVLRLNTEKRGDFIGEFIGEDQILVVLRNNTFYLSSFDLSNHYSDQISVIEKFDVNKIWTAIFFDADQENYYLKRFTMDGNTKIQGFIGDNKASKLICLSDAAYPQFEIKFKGVHSDRPVEKIDAEDFIAIKSFKARGKRLTTHEVAKIKEIEPLVREQEVVEIFNEESPSVEAKEALDD
jgi:topoisomerase-4 subunit A